MLLRSALRNPVARCRPLSRRYEHTTAVHASTSRLDNVLIRSWLLQKPDTKLTSVQWHGDKALYCFSVIRDDLLHPIAGSKLRKFDAGFADLLEQGVTDIVTCGGLQSAHTAAVAALAAEHGIRAHLLVRGERMAVPTGFHLVARMMGEVTYIPRSEYADRDAMFDRHTCQIRARLPAEAKVAIIPEGASEVAGLPGLIRLVQYLAEESSLGGGNCNVVVDSGTGTTAIGMALGVALMRLPWRITGVMLAGSREYYEDQAVALTSVFQQRYGSLLDGELPLDWRERLQPRKFGKVLPGEIAVCQRVARDHGILLDPIYSLAAWEMAEDLSVRSSSHTVMLHAGGALALHGLAQRFPEEF